MNKETWAAVDEYIDALFAPADAALEAALHDSAAAGLPAIHITANQGKLLALLAQTCGAQRILEIGTLGGYSAIHLGRALPAGGRMITLEANPRHAEVARHNLARAGLDGVVEVRLGAAQDTLAKLAADGEAPFDFVFIDADKPGYVSYLEWAIKLTRRGSLIVADNVVRSGAVIDPASADANVIAARRFNARLAADPRLSAVVLQTVGVKGYDGFAIARVVGD